MTHRTSRRQGFTLPELLVVIGIIVVLMSLITAFIFSAAAGRRASNTELTIQTVYKFLQQHWSQVIADAKAEDVTDPALFANLRALSGATANLDPKGERAKVIWIKLRLMEAFPQSFAEVNDPKNAVFQALSTFIPPNRRKWSSIYQDPKTKAISLQSYNKALRDSSGNLLLQAKDPRTESSACLLMALSMNRGGVQSLSADMLPSSIADTDGDGIKELIDAWTQPGPNPPSTPGMDYSSELLMPPAGSGPPPLASSTGKPQPLRFYRFAWNTAIQGTMPAGLAAAANPTFDPVDNKGLLLNPGWYNTKVGASTLGANYVQATQCAITATPANPVGGANYIIPVITSAGKDNWFGLRQENANAALLGQLIFTPPATTPDDNIYSFNLRSSP